MKAIIVRECKYFESYKTSPGRCGKILGLVCYLATILTILL